MGRLVSVCGSARIDGSTGAALNRLHGFLPFPSNRLALAEKRVLPFSYEQLAKNDDFDEVIAAILAHDAVLFATPVYWYSMSAQLKALFDRFTDLLSDRDPTRRGRALAGRRMWLLVVGTDPALPVGFEVPFSATAAYLGMEWRAACYLRQGTPPAATDATLASFAGQIASAGA